MVTAAQIKKLCPSAKTALVDAVVRGWPKAEAAGITMNPRIRHFLCNVAVETGGLSAISESLNYSVEGLLNTFGRHRISEADARKYGRAGSRKANQKAIANIVYGGEWGRKNLGNTQPNDGWDMRGGGMLQTTGRANYRKQGFEDNPEALRDPDIAFETAVREWASRGCNELADRDDTVGVRKAINGGTNGLSELRAYLKKAETIWPGDGGLKPVPSAPVSSETIRLVQTRLLALGYTEVGNLDGKMGTMTRTAILAFRLDNQLPMEPVIDDAMLQALSRAHPRRLAVEREHAPPSEVRKKVPEVQSNFLSKIISAITGLFSFLGAVIAGVFDQFDTARGYIDPVTSYLTDVPGWVWLLMIAAVAATIFLVSRKGERRGVEAFHTGARR